MPDRLLTPRQAAALLAIGTRTLYRWVRAGLLPAPVRLGPTGKTPRWRESDILAYIEAKGHARRPAPVTHCRPSANGTAVNGCH